MIMTSVDLPTAAFVQEMLSESGWAVNCTVAFEHIRIDQRGHDNLVFISLKCPVNPEIPLHLVLKTAPKASRESAFYTAVRSKALPIPRCFAAYSPKDGNHSYILLEDLTQTHTNACDWPSPLPVQAAEDVIDALAKFHAAFWEDPSLGGQPVPVPDFLSSQRAYETYLGFLRRDFEHYSSRLANLVPVAHLRLYTSVLTYLPHLWEEFWAPRLVEGRTLPIIHGDLNPCNVLYPHTYGDRVCLIDWEAHRRGLPTSDLAMLLGLHLCPDQEETLPLLRRYHTGLFQSGVRNYSFEDLLVDYQTALLYELFFPLKIYCQSGIQDQMMIDNAILALESFSDAVI
jgi:aminoglycoside phosphotransferase (APT) family kinase protein